MAQASDYTGLIPAEHATAPNFVKMVGLVAGCFADITNALREIESKFDLDTALGAQLDQIGIWVGIARYVPTPLTGIYFSFDTANVGFDQGSWKGPYDPDTGITSLDDETYRTMIRAKIAANMWDGTMPNYRKVMAYVFQSFGAQVVAVDHQDMTMDVYFFGAVFPAVFTALLAGGYFQVKPAGVKINGYHVQPMFGYDQQDTYISGFDTGYFIAQL